MHWKIFKSIFFLFLFVIFLSNPKPSYALYCTLEFTYRPTVVIAKAEEQTPDVKECITITRFNKNLTIKGSSPNQFEIKTFNPNAGDVCKTYPRGLQSASSIAGVPPDPQFEIGKKYLVAIFPDNKTGSMNASLGACGNEIATEVSGVFDPKVILTTIKVYTQPIWSVGVFVTMSLFVLVFGKFLPDILALVLSGLIVLTLYGFATYFLFRIIRYLIRKIRKLKLN